MSDELELKWIIDNDILDGYPHIYYKELPVFGEKWKISPETLSGYPYIYNRNLLEFASKTTKWKIAQGVLDGYPHCYFKELIPPYHLPQFASMAISRDSGFIGVGDGLTVTVTLLKYIALGDSLAVEVYNAFDDCVFIENVALTQEGTISSFSHTISDSFIQSLAVGEYSVKVTVKRSTDEIGTTASLAYTVNALPVLTVKTLSPATLQKPVVGGNNELELAYEMSGAGIAQITNTFTVAGFQAAETVKSAESLVIESETRTSSIYDVTMNFDVTDANFKLISFKFKFGLYNSSTEVDYRIDGVTVQKGNYPMGGWVEYIAPTPKTLSPGAHSIRLYNSPSYWYLYSTTAKPTVLGMTITSATVYAMEMVYSISSSGVGGERVIKITVDDTVQPGDYPVAVESSAVLDGHGVYTFCQTTADMLTVLEAAVLEPSIGGIALSKSGRYIGCERDVEVTVSGLADVRDGDTITVSLKNGSTVLYENTVSLSQDNTSYSHTIPASEFKGLGIGSYLITAEVKRGSFSEEKSTAYSVVAAPTVSFVSITPDTIQLPITSPLTVTGSWAVNGAGVNTVQGNISLNGTSYSANVNTSGTAFNTVFTNISALAAGLYAINVNLTLTSNEYGAVTITDTHTDSLTVLAPIPEPEIGAVSLSVAGRYIGSETAVTVTASAIQNILGGDTITVRLYQSATVYYEYTETLAAGASSFTRIIPQDKFVGLSAGDYAVRVYISRNNTVRSDKETAYRVAAIPAVQMESISQESIQLPILTPETIMITLAVSGEGISNISGTVGLDETPYSQAVNTENPQITATLSNVQNLSAQGYAVSVTLTITSNQYGAASITALFDNALRVLAAVIPTNHRSGNVYIYKDFELVHILKSYISFKWVRRYNKSGEFILQLANTPANINLIKSGNIIAKDNDDEAGFIEDISITDKIEVKGAFISKMLSYRVVNFTSETPVDLQTTAEQIIRWNYINSGSDRAIPGLRIMDYAIAPQNVMAKIENGSVEQWLENQDAGFKIAFNTAENTFDFSMYDGKRSDAVFCESFRNITDQQYYRQTAGAKNVCLVEIDEEQTVTIGSAEGLARREAYVRAGRYDPGELGAQFLRRNEPVESLDVKIVNPYTPFEYKRDYDIGDIVTITSQSYGVEITKNILEVTEFFDRTGFHLYVVFGSIPRDLLTELRDKNDRLDVLEKLPEAKPSEELSEETIENLKELIIPEIVDEVFEQLEFPPLPDYLTEDKLRETIETIVDRKLDGFNPPGGDGIHIIIDHLPATQAEIDTFPLNAEVLVYNPDNPYVPPN